MSEDAVDQPTPLQDFTEAAHEKIGSAQDNATCAFKATADYIKANPLIAVVGAAVIGGAIVALAKSSRPAHSNLDSIRDWFDEAYAKLPSQKDVRKMAESAGVPKNFLSQLAKALHLCK